MIEFEVCVTISRRPGEVFDFLSDPRNDPAWAAEITEVRKTSSGQLALGGSFVQAAHFLGHRFEVPITVTEYEPSRSMAITPTRGPIRLAPRR